MIHPEPFYLRLQVTGSKDIERYFIDLDSAKLAYNEMVDKVYSKPGYPNRQTFVELFEVKNYHSGVSEFLPLANYLLEPLKPSKF